MYKKRRENIQVILDLGCGENKHPEAIGIDKERKQNDIVGDAHYLPFREKIFETIVSFEMFEHLESPHNVLMEIHRVLKEEGKLTLTFPNIKYYRRIIRYIRNKPITQSEEHIYCWGISEFRNLLNKCNFKIKKESYMDITHFHKKSIFYPILKHLTRHHTKLEVEKNCELSSEKKGEFNSELKTPKNQNKN